jgi:hypothetical protein
MTLAPGIPPQAMRATVAARAGGRTPPGVEPGVTGKERQFQQNRQFGPGAMVPFPYSSPPSGPRSAGRSGGVYHGGAKAQPIPGARPNSTRGQAV